MKKATSVLLSMLFIVSIISPCQTAIAQEIEQNNAVIVAEKVTDMCEKYDEEEIKEQQTKNTDTIYIKDRLIVKSSSKINTYDAVDSIYGLGYVFIQFDEKQDADEAYDTYSKKGYTVQYDRYVSACDTTSTSTTNSKWAYERIEAPQALEQLAKTNINYDDVTVGVIDSGVNYNHELLKDRIIDTKANFSSSGEENDVMDDYDHGTCVAGVIAMSTPKNVKIMPYKVLDKTGRCTVSQLFCALSYILNSKDKPDVINMSLSIYDPIGYIETDLFTSLYEEGITLVVSAGNDTYDAKWNKPSCIEEAIVVSASDENNKKCDFSNFGKSVDVAAPGTMVYTSSYTGDYENNFNGTSASAPFVSAAAALVIMQNQNIEPAEVEKKIKGSAVPEKTGSSTVDMWCGSGILNMPGLVDNEKPSNVDFNYSQGDYIDPIELELTTNNSNSIIKYTTDMSIPSFSNGNTYTEPISITEHTYIIAVAIDKNDTSKKSYYTGNDFRIIYNETEDKFTISDKGVIESYSGDKTAIVIPDTINSITPISVGPHCFENSNIEYVKAPDTITDIHTYAFHESKLNEIIAPGVINCYGNSFSHCYDLTKEYMPKVEYLSPYAFYYCQTLSNVSFKESLIDIEVSALSATNLQEANFPNLETINCSFSETPIVSANLPKLKELKGGFDNCAALCEVYIPNVTKITKSAFECCFNLTDMDFSNITYVGNTAFMGSYFTEINLPNCTYIGDDAFNMAECKKISIPKATTVGKSAFFYVTRLESISMDNVTSFSSGDTIFKDCLTLKYLYLPNSTNLPTFSWTSYYVDKIEQGIIKPALQWIYAPLATKANTNPNDLQYYNNLEYMYLPMVKSMKVNMPTNNKLTVYFNDLISLEKGNGYYKNFDFNIIAPSGSYAQTFAQENGCTFTPSDTLANDKGGSIRIGDNGGLRFGFDWDSINDIESLASDIKYGFIYSYSEMKADELTADYVGTNGVKQKSAQNKVTTDNNTEFNLVFTGVPKSAYDQEISARAYVCIDGMYFYSDVCTRSFSDVANAILEDDDVDLGTKDAINNMLNI